jgi:hypothetical protein
MTTRDAGLTQEQVEAAEVHAAGSSHCGEIKSKSAFSRYSTLFEGDDLLANGGRVAHDGGSGEALGVMLHYIYMKYEIVYSKKQKKFTSTRQQAAGCALRAQKAARAARRALCATLCAALEQGGHTTLSGKPKTDSMCEAGSRVGSRYRERRRYSL